MTRGKHSKDLWSIEPESRTGQTKKIDQLQRKIEELKELLFGIETTKPTEEAEFEEDLYKCEIHLDDLEEGRVTTSTWIVFDAASHQANELSLNDCLCPGRNLNPNLLDALINVSLNGFAISSDIRQAFLQICLPDFFMYVDDWITGQDTREEALFMSRYAKNIMEEAGMEMRKWISNDTALMAQWAAEGFDIYPMDASISLGKNETKVLGMAWQTLDDCLTLDTKDQLRIPRLVLDSTNDEISDLIEIHIFSDASKLAYGAAVYVKEISKFTDPDSWFNCSGQDNPSDFLSRGLSVDSLLSNKWWNGLAFLRTDELPETVSEFPELNEEEHLPELKSKDSKKNIVLTLNFNQTFFDHLLSRSNRFLTIVRVLSFIYRFLFNIRNPANKKKGPLTSDEMEEAEINLIKQVQLGSFYTEI
ncbi:DUF1758 domain-containing protein [Trichonephila clavipes]|nr:DUF1758 domain-containing protein [Trichonephila clavipes]